MSFQYSEPFEDIRENSSSSFVSVLRMPGARTIAIVVICLITMLAIGGYFYSANLLLEATRREARDLSMKLDQARKSNLETLLARIDDCQFDPREQSARRKDAKDFAAKELPGAGSHEKLVSDNDQPVSTSWNASIKIINATVGENYRHIDLRIEDPSTHQFIQNLSRKDFELTLNGKRVSQAIVQTIETNLEKRAIALLQDKSASMKGLPDAHATQAMAWFVNAYAGPSTKLLVCKFADDTRAVTPWTSDRDLLLEACRPEAPNGSTSLFPGFEKTVELLSRRPELRTLVLLTDGADSRQATLPPGIEERCRLANITAYIIGLKSPALNEELLQRLATATGGKYLRAEDSTQISARLKEVAQKVFVPAYRLIAFVPSDATGVMRLEVGNASIDVSP